MTTEGGKRFKNITRFTTSEKPLVSIITAVLNGEKYLEQTIKSVLEQSYDNIEYIIVDGGSTDGTLNIIKKYDSSIDYWSSSKDNGISFAFNYGIEKSSGEIIGIINSDDWYEPDAVGKIVNVFQKFNPDLVCGAIQFWQNNIKMIKSLSDVERIRYETSIHHSTVFVKKSIYESFGGFDTNYKYAMDYELLLKFKMKGLKFYALNDNIANRRLEGVSFINRKHALAETRKARTIYYSKINVWIDYFYVIVKDYLGRVFKKGIFISFYRFYWKIKNKRLSRDQLL